MIDKLIMFILNRYVIGVSMMLIVLFTGLFVTEKIMYELNQHPEVTQIGTPIEINWLVLGSMFLICIIVACLLSRTDGGINPGNNRP